MKGLTSKQRQILDYIQKYLQRHQYSPSFREIQKHFEFRSLGSVYRHIKSLQERGVLERGKYQSRSLSPLEPYHPQPHNPPPEDPSSIQIPFVGKVSSSENIEMFAQTNFEYLPTSSVRNANHTYILQIQGNGFANDHLLDGDKIIIDVGSDVQDGDIIMGTTIAQETFIRRHYSINEMIYLHSIYDENSPIEIEEDNLTIQGVLCGVIRSFPMYTQ